MTLSKSELRKEIIKRTHEWIRDCGLDVQDIEVFVDRELVALFEQKLTEARKQAKLDEHKVIQVAVVEAFNQAQEDGEESSYSLRLFDDWRASRYRDLLRHQTNKLSEEKR